MRHLTVHEAAEALHLSVPTIKRYIYDGKLKSTKLPGGQHRIPETEIAALLALRPATEDALAPGGAATGSDQERLAVLERWVTELESEVERLAAGLAVVSTYCSHRCDLTTPPTSPPANSSLLRLAVLGPGCRRCNALYDLTTKVLRSLGRPDLTVERLYELDEIAAFGPVLTPALLIGDTIAVSGRLPQEKALRTLLAERLQ